MRVRLATWKVKTLISKLERINPSPQYQRTSVWSIQKKKLLIDSMLRGYDIPKFYLRSTPNDPFFEYEVTDGQQRIRAISEFILEGPERYVLDRGIINGFIINNKGYEELANLKENLDLYELNIAIIEETTPEEIRSLFARLQMGSQLNQVELRHAMASNIGSAILSVVENHKFFKNCKISNSRYKHQDYLDHAFSLIYFSNKDIKAKNIENLYNELSDATSDVYNNYISTVNSILDWLDEINALQKGIFKNKWAFIDTFWILYTNYAVIERIDANLFVENFRSFEQKRLKNLRNPESLISAPESQTYDKALYEYIMAFKYAGNLYKSIETRHKVFTQIFINNGIVIR